MTGIDNGIDYDNDIDIGAGIWVVQLSITVRAVQCQCGNSLPLTFVFQYFLISWD